MLTEREPIYSERPKQPRNDLEELYRSWGIFESLQATIDILPKDWLVIMNIARNLLDGKPVPGVHVPDALRALTERNTIIEYENRFVTRRWLEPTELPSSEIGVRPIETLNELPKVLPPYLLLTDNDPDIFAYKAVSGDLPVAEYQKPKIVMDEKSKEVEKLEEVRKIGRSMRQKAYVLLDESLSMADNHKFIFARAIVMAYLAKAYEEDAQLYFRSFFNITRERIDCTNPYEFPSLSESVLRIYCQRPNMAIKILIEIQNAMVPQHIYRDPLYVRGTDTGGALKIAIGDVSEIDQLEQDQSATTEILLITDGASHTEIPLIPQNITLHTLHLQGGQEVENDHTLSDYQYKERVTALKNRSRTYTVIDTSALRPPPPEEEPRLLNEEVKRLEEEVELKGVEASRNDNELERRIEKARKMTTAYKRMYPKNKEMRKTEQKMKEIEYRLDPSGIQEAIKHLLKDASQKVKSQFSQQKSETKRNRPIQTPTRPPTSGTLFDFRIKRDGDG